MNATRKAYIELHIAVFLFGFTAILGDLISLSAPVLVWWRMLITSISLLFLLGFGRRLMKLPTKRLLQFMGIGCLVALHWICFFGAVKYSNASITLVCMATTSFMTSLLEPLFTRQKIVGYELLLGLMIVPGMALVVSNVDFSMYTGIVLALVSALLAALFSIFNKILIEKADPISITFIELGSGWLLICFGLLFMFANDPGLAFWPSAKDWIYILILALLCTTLAYVLSLRALKYISAFASNLTVNLEPVYGIILAWWLLQENKELNAGFYWGSLIIVGAVFTYPLLKRRAKKQLS